jgi:hypothetical protein
VTNFKDLHFLYQARKGAHLDQLSKTPARDLPNLKTTGQIKGKMVFSMCCVLLGDVKSSSFNIIYCCVNAQIYFNYYY